MREFDPRLGRGGKSRNDTPEKRSAEVGGRVHRVADAEQARNIVLDICRTLDSKRGARANVNPSGQPVPELFAARRQWEGRGVARDKDLVELNGEPDRVVLAPAKAPGEGRIEAIGYARFWPQAYARGRHLALNILCRAMRFKPHYDLALKRARLALDWTWPYLRAGATGTSLLLRQVGFNQLAHGSRSVPENAGAPSGGQQLMLAPVPPDPPVEKWIRAGLLVLAVTFGGFGLWAALAPLSSASMASGIVKVDSNRKTLQHYEGGIIREILVRDGDFVREGEVLVRLDDLDAQADQNTVRSQLDALVAREARLTAQRDGLEEIMFPDALLARRSDMQVALTIEGQSRIFHDQTSALDAEIAIWRQRTEQHRAQIGVIEAQNKTLAEQLASFEDELAVARGLFERGYERKPRILGLEREVTGGRGEMMANEGRILALKEQIAEAEAQIASLRQDWRRSVSEELREVQTSRAELGQQMQKSEAEVGRKDIVAPQDGVIVDLRYFTPGGIIAPGAEIMDIVPAEDKLIVEARIRPMDVDVVRPDLPAIVRLVAFKQGTTPTLNGRVTRMSADAFTDDRTGEIYFLATVEVDPTEMERVPHVRLHPGMPVDVAVVTGERTLVEYIMQPLTDSLAHAFREN